MCIYIKLMIAIGLGMTFAGLILMIKSREYRCKQQGKKEKAESTAVEYPTVYRISWFLTIVGYILQIVGVFLG
jgi:hypothetical protein